MMYNGAYKKLNNLKKVHNLKILDNLKKREILKKVDNLKNLDNLGNVDNLKKVDNLKILDNLKMVDNFKNLDNFKKLDSLKNLDNFKKSPLDRSATARLARPLHGYLGKFFEQSVNNSSGHPYSFASKLKIAIHRLKPVAPRSSMRAPFISENITGYAQVFLQTATKPHRITPVYSGPKTVISRPDKTVTISKDDRDVTVAIDRTKPAFVDNDRLEPLTNNRPRRVIFSQAPTVVLPGE
uniref:Uncharacterized protein n=1 Tax=Trichuris muris TaxID=70415 RepID=A0A5S6R067_TRIMR